MTATGQTGACTDVENAERLVEMHADDLRYVGSWGKGLAWDGSRWIIDDKGYWTRAAIKTARVLLVEATEAVEVATLAVEEAKAKDKKAQDEANGALARANKRYAWAHTSQSAARIKAMIELAHSVPRIILHHSQLDADPWLLNVRNGTIDLKTGELREHRREDLITKIATVDFDPDAGCPRWESFVSRVMGDDAEVISYLQRIIGYALTGSVQEHILGFFFGGGANGKSTFLSTIHAMLGDYASPAPRGLLFRSHGEKHPTEYASLHGRRFVTCSEIEEGQAFDEALVKDLTGGDPIECRRMREDFWTFQPTHKLFLAGNHKPTVRGDDEGIWRRMRLVPWLVTIPEAERDTTLVDKLREELTGILAWAVRGCLSWLKDGLKTPAAVTGATRAYREENDVVGEFMTTALVFDPEARIARKDLRETYEAFCAEAGVEPLGGKRFAGRLRERGVRGTAVRKGMSVVNGWCGVRLMTDAERAAAAAWSNPAREPPLDDELERLAIIHENEA